MADVAIRVIYAQAVPTTGAWNVGDMCFNSMPSVGAPISWHCVASGTPGTWIASASAGTAGNSYLHNQAATSQTWTINHNLGFKPNIGLYGIGGSKFEAEILHISDNQAIVYLVSPVAGFARCN